MCTSPPAQPADYSNLDPEALASHADQLRWFHAIDFDNFQSSGRFQPSTPQNRTLYGVFDLIQQMDLHGQNCLDIGTADGLLAFGMETLGAQKVTATNTYPIDSFALARTALRSQIEYRPNLQIKDLLGVFEPASFDLVACAGVIYHMLNPLSALLVGRQLVKEGGYFVVETAYAPGNDTAAMIFNPVAEINLQMSTYWLPTRSALEGMMRMAGFELVATRTIRRMPRITVVGRAVKPTEVSQRSTLLKKMHDVDFRDHEFRFKQLFANVRAASSITMKPVAAYEDIDPNKWAGSYPHHPRTLENPKGRTRWSAPDGNN